MKKHENRREIFQEDYLDKFILDGFIGLENMENG